MSPVRVTKICCSKLNSTHRLLQVSDIQPLVTVGAGYVGTRLVQLTTRP